MTHSVLFPKNVNDVEKKTIFNIVELRFVIQRKLF